MSDTWIEKIEYALKIFRTPFVEDIRLSQIQKERENFYLLGQALTVEINRLRKVIRDHAAPEFADHAIGLEGK